MAFENRISTGFDNTKNNELFCNFKIFYYLYNQSLET